jgi:hypothetical protein
MLDLIRNTWAAIADTLTPIAAGALDAIVILWGALGALPLPVGLTAVTAGLALFHAIDQRAQRRDPNH